MSTSADELRSLEKRHQRALRVYETARSERNAAVRQAIQDGWTHAQIAEAMGLTRARVGQIALAKP